ncbi:MAG: FUSC family protein [Fusobacteria bacterium]|nr:FUSC family protein [Fusobacteriota bacterium]
MLNTTRLAIQVTLAILISEIVMHFSHLDKSYWCPMTILYLFSSGQGESNSRAISRLLTTIVAGLLGTLLGTFFHPSFYVYLIIIFIFTYLMFYYLLRSYAWSIFYSVFLVVFLYSSIGGWSVQVLSMRVYETGIGAVIVIIVSQLFPIKENRRLQNELIALFEIVGKRIVSISQFTDSKNSQMEIRSFAELIQAKKKIHSIINNIRYENLFKQKRYTILLRLKKTLNILLFELENLYDVLESSTLSQEKLHEYQNILKILSDTNTEILSFLKSDSVEIRRSEELSDRFCQMKMVMKNQEELLEKSKIEIQIRSIHFQQEMMSKWIVKIVER